MPNNAKPHTVWVGRDQIKPTRDEPLIHPTSPLYVPELADELDALATKARASNEAKGMQKPSGPGGKFPRLHLFVKAQAKGPEAAEKLRDYWRKKDGKTVEAIEREKNDKKKRLDEAHGAIDKLGGK